MKKIVIGLTGEMGAGKDTLVNYLKEKHDNIISLRFSTPLTETLKIFFDEVKREDQQWLVNNLRERFGQDILAKAITKKIKSMTEDVVILNGIRVWDEYSMVKELGGVIVYVTTDAKIRWERMGERKEKADDKSTWEEFLKRSQNATELFIAAIGEKADFKIENNGSLEEFHKKIDELMNKLA
ncbi:MAG: AAA family ATPase [Patescibacteria group bacterium]